MSWIWWLIGTFGLGGAALVVAGFIVGWPVLINFFVNSTIGRVVAALGIVALAILAAFGRGQAKGKADLLARQKAADEKIIKKAKDNETAIGDLPIDDVRKRLRDQSRQH